MTPEEMVSRVLYRDGLMLVIDKPAGMAVHRGPKGGESLEDHFGALRYGLPRAPALAHRLDRDTSGCLVLGRHRKALAELGRLFKTGRVGKTYWAIVDGGPEGGEGRVDLPLGRLDASRGWWMKAAPDGQPAVTTWRVMGRLVGRAGNADDFLAAYPDLESEANSDAQRQGEAYATDSEPRIHPPPHPSLARAERAPTRGEGADPSRGTRREPFRIQGASCINHTAADSSRSKLTWLALEPLTGRTHQLRVHCAEMGWPIVGDAIYGNAPRTDGPGLQLHAREIVVPLYKNKLPVRIVAPVPAHMWECLAGCGWSQEEPDR